MARPDPLNAADILLEAVERLLMHKQPEAPVLVVFEDLHWIDTKKTQALLDSLVESIPYQAWVLKTITGPGGPTMAGAAKRPTGRLVQSYCRL